MKLDELLESLGKGDVEIVMNEWGEVSLVEPRPVQPKWLEVEPAVGAKRTLVLSDPVTGEPFEGDLEDFEEC